MAGITSCIGKYSFSSMKDIRNSKKNGKRTTQQTSETHIILNF